MNGVTLMSLHIEHGLIHIQFNEPFFLPLQNTYRDKNKIILLHSANPFNVVWPHILIMITHESYSRAQSLLLILVLYLQYHPNWYKMNPLMPQECITPTSAETTCDFIIRPSSRASMNPIIIIRLLLLLLNN